VYKWRTRYAQGGWQALEDQSHAPKKPNRRLTIAVKERICQVRRELEAQAHQPGNLNYLGAQVIRSHLQQEGISPVPSVRSIERELRAAGLVRPRQPVKPPKVDYPHLQPNKPHQLVQVDIVPHYLRDNPKRVACFNAIDVVSRYPTGQTTARKRSVEATAFLLYVWRELGIPEYTQVDNESCFSGGFTHPYVLGRVLRLGLWVGTQMVYSPIYHPQSNGFVERFHQDYTAHVWDKYDLPDVATVNQQARQFFTAYRQSCHHSALDGHAPTECHGTYPQQRLPEVGPMPANLSLTVGKTHFIRRVEAKQTVRVLNVDWDVPGAQPDQGVWVTLKFDPQQATLTIYDTAPGVYPRHCLAWHPFPLQEPVLPLQACFLRQSPRQSIIKQLLAYSVQRLSTMF
jgi:transposase InsO family protein